MELWSRTLRTIIPVEGASSISSSVLIAAVHVGTGRSTIIQTKDGSVWTLFDMSTRLAQFGIFVVPKQCPWIDALLADLASWLMFLPQR